VGPHRKNVAPDAPAAIDLRVNFLDRLEKAAGRFAVPGLIRYVVAFNALVYLLLLVSPGYAEMLALDRSAILRGEVWRLVSWIFLPNTSSPIWIFFYLMFTWWLGESLEAVWGAFRLNLYYLIGVIGCTVAALVFGISAGNFLLTLSLLFAIATVAPDEQVLLLIFPVKLKWLALISLVYPWGLLLVVGPLGVKAMIVVCLANYLVFFGPGWVRRFREGRTIRRPSKTSGPLETLHRCEACGVTEVTAPDTEFRVAPDGKEYCSKHLH